MIKGFGPKKPKQQRKAARKEIPFQRVSVNIQVEATKEVIEGRVFMNDLSATGVGCFTNASLDKGEKVALVIEQPKHFYVSGEVAWCTPYTMDTKIISQETFKYRVGIKFLFDEPEDQQAVQNYINELYEQK